MKNQTTQLYKQFVASAQHRAAGSLSRSDLADYFLINGLDYKGQAQVGLLTSGYGGGVGLSASAGIASLAVEAGVDALKRAIVVVQRGPSHLDGEAITTPLLLLALIGRQWVTKLGLSAQAGISAEAGWSFGSDGASTTATHTFKEEPEDPSSSAELVGASASAFAGLSLDASAALDHYWGFDPAPGYYGAREGCGAPLVDALRRELGEALDDGNREKALCGEARALINELRQQITLHYGNDPKGAEFYKKQLGIWFTTVANNKPIDSLSTVRAVEALTEVSDPKQQTILDKLAGPTIHGRVFADRASDLLRRLRPYTDKKNSEPVCWLRMRSAKFKLGAAAGAKAQLSAASPVAKLEAALNADLAAAGVSYQRTGILWHTQLAASQRGALACTQETAITYTSLNAKALAIGVAAEAAAGTWSHGYEYDEATIGKDLHLMSYTCATLYWRRPLAGTGAVAALPGSGLTYGQSFIIKNLRAAIKASKSKGSPTRWIVRMAERLRVPPATLMNFLSAAAVGDLLADLCTSGQTTQVLKSTVDPHEVGGAWDDRAVLIESSFALDEGPSRPAVALAGAVPKGITAALSAHRGRLQSIRMRFRIGDANSDVKTWTLGFKVLGTGMSVSLRSLSEAAAEGVVDLCTVWFDRSGAPLQQDNLSAYEDEGAVPPAVLFCQ